MKMFAAVLAFAALVAIAILHTGRTVDGALISVGLLILFVGLLFKIVDS